MSKPTKRKASRKVRERKVSADQSGAPYLVAVSAIQPKLQKADVRRIKKRIVAGESLNDIAEDFGVAYMVIYKIATGVTWKSVKPRGRLIGERDYTSKRVFPLAKCQAIALLKIQKRLSNARIAKRLGKAESTVRRAVDDGRAALGLRLHRLTIQGNVKRAQRKFGLTEDEVDELVAISMKGRVPAWIRKEIEGDDE